MQHGDIMDSGLLQSKLEKLNTCVDCNLSTRRCVPLLQACSMGLLASVLMSFAVASNLESIVQER